MGTREQSAAAPGASGLQGPAGQRPGAALENAVNAQGDEAPEPQHLPSARPWVPMSSGATRGARPPRLPRSCCVLTAPLRADGGQWPLCPPCLTRETSCLHTQHLRRRPSVSSPPSLRGDYLLPGASLHRSQRISCPSRRPSPVPIPVPVRVPIPVPLPIPLLSLSPSRSTSLSASLSVSLSCPFPRPSSHPSPVPLPVPLPVLSMPLSTWHCSLICRQANTSRTHLPSEDHFMFFVPV